ncbi:MAG: hypothetical protein HQ537_01790 [Parcubacteria group bacterium]|nr:hypothetical protein [Parcubacteria group bacterium]
MTDALKKTTKILGQNTWAVFGSAAVAVYYGKIHRDGINDIDIIVEEDEQYIKSIFQDHGIQLNVQPRNRRSRGYCEINEMKIEVMFAIDKHTIDLADGKFKFQKIEFRNFENINVPVIDLGSLLESKDRYLRQIKNEDKKSNLLKDIETLKNIK